MLNTNSLRQLTQTAFQNERDYQERLVSYSRKPSPELPSETDDTVRLIEAQLLIDQIEHKCETAARQGKSSAKVMNLVWGHHFDCSWDRKVAIEGHSLDQFLTPTDLRGSAVIVWNEIYKQGLLATIQHYDGQIGIVIHW